MKAVRIAENKPAYNGTVIAQPRNYVGFDTYEY